MPTDTTPATPANTPAASTAAPAAAASAPAAAAPAAPIKPVVTDITPNQSKVHKVVIPAAQVNAFIAQIDPTAPVGKTVREVNVGFDAKGEMSIRITYNP